MDKIDFIIIIKLLFELENTIDLLMLTTIIFMLLIYLYNKINKKKEKEKNGKN